MVDLVEIKPGASEDDENADDLWPFAKAVAENFGRLKAAIEAIGGTVSKVKTIYPNGGSEGNEANITINSYYLIDNPFPGKKVRCIAELFYNGKWGQMPNGTHTYVTGGGAGLYGGLNVGQVGDDIALKTALNQLLITAGIDANLWNTGVVTVTTAPCRVVVECIE